MLNKLTFLSAVLILSFKVNAGDFSLALTGGQSVGAFPVGIGSTVNLTGPDASLSGSSVFLGSAVRPDQTSSYLMFLNTITKKVNYIDSTYFGSSLNTSSMNSKLQTVFDLFEQAGGTCTGYAMYDFLQQTNLSKLSGNGELAKTLSSEEGRTNLLVDSVNQYYLVTQHRYSINGILNGYGKQYGFKCNSFRTDSFAVAKTKVLAQLKTGLPVLFSFNIGPNMYSAPFSIQMAGQKNVELDNRLWIPRKTGERNSGGHSVVAAGSFELNNKTYLVMIDSDWSEPRIWDMDSFLNDKTALGEVEFVSCK